MDKSKLKLRHYYFLAKRIGISILEALQIKDLIRKEIDKNPPMPKEALGIDKTRDTIIVLPNIAWSFRKQRPQQIFSRLAKKRFNIFYISPIISKNEYISLIGENIYEVHCKSQVSGDVLRYFHLDLNSEDLFVQSLQNLLGEYIKSNSLLFVLHPVWKNISFKLKGMKVIYDLMDLYEGFPNARKELIGGERELISKSNIVLTTADNLYEYARGLNRNVHIVRNGCDYEMFNRLERNRELDCLEDKPIIGYYGAISSWFDVVVLEEVIKGNRDKYFVFLGAINTPKAIRLFKYSNVYFLGEVENSELPGYLAYFDVCTIPFVLNDLILNTNPVKFYEYICSGKPVIAPQLPELKQYSDICYLYNNGEEFNGYINEALKEKKVLKEKRKRVGKENSWDRRVEEIVKIIS